MMTITTLAGVVSGAQPPVFFTKRPANGFAMRWQTHWATSGIPGAGSYDTTLNGVTLSSTGGQVTGQLLFLDPPSNNAYLARFRGLCGIGNSAATAPAGGGIILLCDRLWHNGGLTTTSTSPQSITSPTWPSRDADGGTDGRSVMLAVEVSASVGAATPDITVSYTNSQGTSGRSAIQTEVTTSGAAASSMYFIGLQSGDVGVRSVQSLTLSASWISGTINLVAYRVIAALDVASSTAIVANECDAITLPLGRLYNGTVPYICSLPASSANSHVFGQIVVSNG